MPSAAAVEIPEDVYDALLRLASTHAREVCECENCTPERHMAYDSCKCGDDWSGCVDDVATVEAFVPRRVYRDRLIFTRR